MNTPSTSNSAGFALTETFTTIVIQQVHESGGAKRSQSIEREFPHDVAERLFNSFEATFQNGMAGEILCIDDMNRVTFDFDHMTQKLLHSFENAHPNGMPAGNPNADAMNNENDFSDYPVSTSAFTIELPDGVRQATLSLTVTNKSNLPTGALSPEPCPFGKHISDMSEKELTNLFAQATTDEIQGEYPSNTKVTCTNMYPEEFKDFMDGLSVTTQGD